MSLEKKYLKSRPVCKVRFIAPEAIVQDAKKITVAGDFNDWNPEETKLRKQKSGLYTTTVDLDIGNEYQYRFVVDGTRWENDWAADKYVPNNQCGENSVVIV